MSRFSSSYINQLVVFAVLLLLTLVLWGVDLYQKSQNTEKLFFSFVAVSALYFIFGILLENMIAKRISEPKTRFSFRKTINALFLMITFIVILRIWIINPQALLVAYGLLAAGIAISLQDIFKNFAGGIIIFVSRIYQIGNRIEIGGKFGDVIDINMFYTTMLEIREWINGDQATGRISVVPNGMVLSSVINNYTKDHHFLWDEISIPVTYDSDWKLAVGILERLAKEASAKYADEASRSLSGLEDKYYLKSRPTEPVVFVTITDNWIMLRLRYVVEVRERRPFHSRLSKMILEEFQKTSTITIASSTISIVDFPKQSFMQSQG